MTTADDLFDMVDEMESAPLNDKTIFVVDENLRTIAIPSNKNVLGVYSDDKVRRVWFSIPAEYQGTDLTEFDIFINYSNPDGDGDRYTVTDAVLMNRRFS